MNYGIVAEFNPFHNGHKYIVDSLKNGGENTVTAVMSESFVQRSECACASPYVRTQMALANGVDLVLSLPVPYATASAERFASAGVAVLSALGVVDALGFGSECGSKELIKECATALLDEGFDLLVQKYLQEGVSYPEARCKALEESFGKSLAQIISTPNDILGVEYTKAIIKNGFCMDINPIKRIGASHDSKEAVGDICSASAVREMLLNNESAKTFLPPETYSILQKVMGEGKAPADFKKLEAAILYKLRTMSVEDFSRLSDVSEGLEYRLYTAVRGSSTLNEVLEKVKTKRYTLSRIRRIIICAFLGITKQEVELPVPYIRVLGFNEKGARLLKDAKEKATLPIVTKPAQLKELNVAAQRLFDLECTARDLFSLALPQPDICGKEMTDKIIVW